MSELKCPFCQQELNQDNPQSIECRNDDCKKSYFMYGSKELWQALTDSMKEHDLCHDALVERTKELDRTRKALDVAVDALKTIKYRNETYNRDDSPDCIDATLALDQIKALKEITALEQKESAFVHNKIEFPEYNDNLLEEFDKQFFENGQDDDLTETALEQKDVK